MTVDASEHRAWALHISAGTSTDGVRPSKLSIGASVILRRASGISTGASEVSWWLFLCVVRTKVSWESPVNVVINDDSGFFDRK